LGYYPPSQSRYAVVEQSGDLSRENGGDTKVASRSISLKFEISIADLVKFAIDYTFSKCTPIDPESPASATGEYGAASATGNRGAASATGNRGAASATGNVVQLRLLATVVQLRLLAIWCSFGYWQCSFGYWRIWCSFGYWQYGAASATGNMVQLRLLATGAASATGYQGAASATGEYGAASATGDQGAASLSRCSFGYWQPWCSFGYWQSWCSFGYWRIWCSFGYWKKLSSMFRQNKAKACETGAIVLTYRNYQDEIIHIRASKVGENGIKADTWYQLNEDGNFVEVEA
jgi:hypothetical protein